MKIDLNPETRREVQSEPSRRYDIAPDMSQPQGKRMPSSANPRVKNYELLHRDSKQGRMVQYFASNKRDLMEVW